MKTVLILGTGCAKCKQLAANTQRAVAELGIPCDIREVTDVNKICEFGVMLTPALVIDGQVVAVGKVPSTDEIKDMLA